MRTWVYNRIKNIAGLPAGIGDRVISSGSADNPGSPFMVVQMGTEDPPLGATAEERTQQVPFTVWVHDKPGSMILIDDVTVLLKNNLPTQDGVKVGGMSVYRLKWESTGEDAYDDHYKTNTRPVRFSMMTRR